MSKYGLTVPQEYALFILHEDGEVEREPASHFKGRSGREIKVQTILALHDKGLVSAALTKRKPSLPAKFSATLSPFGERVAQDLIKKFRKPTAPERARQVLEEALA